MRIFTILATLVLLLVTAGTSVFAAKPATGWTLTRTFTWQRLVEQQTPGGATQPDQSLWVTNPTINTSQPCVWDADDGMTLTLYGPRVSPGQSITGSLCIIGDWAGHLFSVNRHPDIEVTVDYDGLLLFVMPNTLACIRGPEYDSDAVNYGLLTEIAGSNGGVGKITIINVTAKNTSKRTVRDAVVGTSIALSVTSRENVRCPSGGPLYETGERYGSYPGPNLWYSY